MTMKKTLNIFTLVVLCMLALVSCKKEYAIKSFGASLEQPGIYDKDNKCVLNDEHFIFWEAGDSIAVTNDWTDAVTPETHASGTRDTRFYGEEEEEKVAKVNLSSTCYAIYPSSSFVSGSSNTLKFPNEMPYRDDFSFGIGSFPMVAYSENPETSGIGFHSVCGIARVQIFSTLAGTQPINEIEFEEVGGSHDRTNKQISGNFTINGINQYNPYLTQTAATEDNRKIKITRINGSVGTATGTSKNTKSNLLTFYLPLPATSDGTGYNKVNYILKMKVKSGSNYFEKVFSVDIRRNCITMMPAVNITKWELDQGQANVHLVGCGTKARPFQIYTFNELVKVRDAINEGGKVNDQEITSNTYFRLVRADIRLLTEAAAADITPDENGVRHYQTINTANGDHSQMYTCGAWTRGIKEFKGHFTCAANHAEIFGIENKSYAPLFESISANGVVDSVTVRGGFTVTGTPVGDFSPLCLTNNGKMSNCVNQCNITLNDNVAGICYTNNGTITGCRNEGSLIANASGSIQKDVAGICMINKGSGTKGIHRCVLTSSGKLNGAHVGGIVLTNDGHVTRSYANINQSAGRGEWGGIAHTNSTNSTIQNCYVSGNLTSTNGSVGGICNRNAGNILYCYNTMGFLRGSNKVGGISAEMSAGEIRNCYMDGNGGTITSNQDFVEIGGFVGRMTGGDIRNGYCVFACQLGHSEDNGSEVATCVGNIQASTGNVTIWNVYTIFNVSFYGKKSTVGSNTVSITDCYACSVPQGETGIGRLGKTNTTPVRVYLLKKNESDQWVEDTEHPLWGVLDGNVSGNATHYLRWQKGNHPVFDVNAK